MTEQEDYIRKLEARIEKLEKKVDTINADLNSLEEIQQMTMKQAIKCNMLERNIAELEENINPSYDLAKAIHEMQEILREQGHTMFNTIYAPNKVGGV